jgi:hypothetical protein
MRSLLAKFFLCMLLVPVVVHSGGLLLSAALDEPRIAVERVFGTVLPLYVQAVGTALDQGGPAAAAAMVATAAARAAPQLSLRLVPLLHTSCRAGDPPPLRSRLPRPRRASVCSRRWRRVRASAGHFLAPGGCRCRCWNC